MGFRDIIEGLGGNSLSILMELCSAMFGVLGCETSVTGRFCIEFWGIGFRLACSTGRVSVGVRVSPVQSFGAEGWSLYI